MASIELKDDLKHQKLAWRIKRIGYWAIFLLVIFAVLGLFSEGILSSSEIVSQNSRLQYQRFLRAGAPADLNFYLRSSNDSLLWVKINNDYISKFKIETISPQPASETAGNDFTLFSFNNSKNSLNLITFSFNAEKPGIAGAVINASGSDFIFKQYIYP